MWVALQTVPTPLPFLNRDPIPPSPPSLYIFIRHDALFPLTPKLIIERILLMHHRTGFGSVRLPRCHGVPLAINNNNITDKRIPTNNGMSFPSLRLPSSGAARRCLCCLSQFTLRYRLQTELKRCSSGHFRNWRHLTTPAAVVHNGLTSYTHSHGFRWQPRICFVTSREYGGKTRNLGRSCL